MPEYIEREALIDALQAYQYDAGKDGFGIMAVIGTQPAVDVVAVVRCKDCKWYKRGIVFKDTMFCYRPKEDGDPLILFLEACTCDVVLEAKVQFCPMCGRRLDGGDADG